MNESENTVHIFSSGANLKAYIHVISIMLIKLTETTVCTHFSSQLGTAFSGLHLVQSATPFSVVDFQTMWT